ncbi:MAG: PKD domain-containing protein [Planctomycetes bacterium]|nr:PKD domain-containing protein [Planctomycetota bacterium]
MSPTFAQNCLSTLYAQNANGNTGGAVYFDLTVSQPVVIDQIAANLGLLPANGVGITVYTNRSVSTYAGNETDAHWSAIAASDGTAASGGANSPTVLPLITPIRLSPGTYPWAIVASGTGHAYTRGLTTQTFADSVLSLEVGSATHVPFSGVPFTPRWWNGTICYEVATGAFANFEVSATSGTSPFTVQFTDTSYTQDPQGIQSWAWDFDGDGVIDSTQANPSFTYTSCGAFDVSLTVADAMSPPSTYTAASLIEVDPQLRVDADFTATLQQGTAPLHVQFADVSTNAPTSWAWDLDGDGVIDSTQQSPTMTYTQAGFYTVSLTAANGCFTDMETKTHYVHVIGTTSNALSPEVLELNFNGMRSSHVQNTASTTVFPDELEVVSLSGTWSGDPNREAYRGNEAGFGCLGTGTRAWVDTNQPLELAGSFTISFWLRRSTTATFNPYGDVVGDGTLHVAVGGVGGSGIIFRRTAIGDVQSQFTVIDRLGVWQHLTLVVDDTAGQALWYQDGVADTNVVSFTAGTFAYSGTSNLAVGAYNDGGFSIGFLANWYDLDDFRIYSRALTPSQVQSVMNGETPTTSSIGRGCADALGNSARLRANDAPQLGNAHFVLEVSGMEPSRPSTLAYGVFADANGLLPLDLQGTGLFAAGCWLEVQPVVIQTFDSGAGTVSFPTPIPADVALVGSHLYVQSMTLGSGTTSGISNALDVNVQL